MKLLCHDLRNILVYFALKLVQYARASLTTSSLTQRDRDEICNG